MYNKCYYFIFGMQHKNYGKKTTQRKQFGVFKLLFNYMKKNKMKYLLKDKNILWITTYLFKYIFIIGLLIVL